ncbi:MAG TPA: hypothetical protein VJ765_02870 [Chitinophagaceae bacterium]|nr:hypothetical protein [Chitinophagaceae bacterium]
MKRIFFGLIICFSLFITQSCDDDNTTKESKELSDSDVPATVKSAFSAKYSTATEVKWEDASENNVQTYQAKFMLNGKKMKAEFDGTGTFVKEEEDN